MNKDKKNNNLSLRKLKRNNRALIISCIKDHQSVARAEIAEMTNLDRKSITNFSHDLIEEGIVIEAGKKASTGNRPYALLKLNHEFLLAGISVSSSKCLLLVSNLLGESLYKEEQIIRRNIKKDKIQEILQKFIEYLKINYPKRIKGLGIVIQGKLSDEGVLLESTNLPQLVGFEFGHFFRHICPYTIKIDKLTRGFLLAEKYFTKNKETKNMMVLQLDDGVGSSMYLDGKIYKGKNNESGEVGHMIVEAGGKACSCGKKGCLETYVSTREVLNDINVMLPDIRVKKIIDIKKIKGEKKVKSYLNELAKKIAIVLDHVDQMLDLEKVVIGGELSDLGDEIMEPIKNAYREVKGGQEIDKNFISVSECKDLPAMGAVALIMQHIVE